jgi:type IV secretory pathway VirB10-like protein
MIPQSQPRPVKNSSKVNLTISAVVHGAIIVALIYFAAREGYLGKKIQKISVEMVKEKKPEPEKPKPEPPKVEPPKIEPPKNEPPKYVEPAKVASQPTVAPPVVAPPTADVPSFEFEGGKAVNSESDPVQLYKGYLEYALRSKWNRPENLPDDSYVVEVGVNVDKQGNLSQPVWQKSSGDQQWDQSVKDVFKVVTQIDRRPPTNFPPTMTIRFDVQEETEPVMP